MGKQEDEGLVLLLPTDDSPPPSAAMKPQSPFLPQSGFRLCVLLAAVAVGMVIRVPAQTSQPPHTWHRATVRGTFATYNDSRTFTGIGAQPEMAFQRQGFTTGVSGAGSASDTVDGGNTSAALYQSSEVGLKGMVFFGHLNFFGTAKVANRGQLFVNATPGSPESLYITRYANAGATLDLGYQDILDVESATLPPGTAVTLKLRFSAWGGGERSVEEPVTVTYPPTGPGFPSTTAQELRLTTQKGYIASSNNAGFVVKKADGSYVTGSTMDGRVEGEWEGSFTAFVGGTVQFSHSVSGNAEATAEGPNGGGISSGDYSAMTSISFHTSLYCWPTTESVTLRSRSGHNYAPPTGTAGLLQVRSSPTDMVLTAPAGFIFQKATVTPTGFVWKDLTETRMLIVPFTEPHAFFRAVQP